MWQKRLPPWQSDLAASWLRHKCNRVVPEGLILQAEQSQVQYTRCAQVQIKWQMYVAMMVHSQSSSCLTRAMLFKRVMQMIVHGHQHFHADNSSVKCGHLWPPCIWLRHCVQPANYLIACVLWNVLSICNAAFSIELPANCHPCIDVDIIDWLVGWLVSLQLQV